MLGSWGGSEVLAERIGAGGVALDQQGNPVAGVVIFDGQAIAPSFRRPGQGVLGLTDPKGHWSLTNAPERLTFAHPDFARETVPGSTEVVLLKRGTAIRGVVVDDSGRGIEGVRILGGDFPVWTPVDGRFEFRNCRAGTLVLVAEAPGYAASWTKVDVRDRAAELRWVLQPAKARQLRVVDSAQLPVPEAEVTIEQWGAPVPWDWSWRTATNGRVLWANAPTGDVRCVVTKMGCRPQHAVRLVPGQTNLEVVLRRERSVNGRVRGESGQPVEDFTVLSMEPRPEGSVWRSEPRVTVAGAGEFLLPLPGEAPAFVRVTAPGFESAGSRRIEAEEETVVLDFKLPKAGRITGVVCDVQDRPVPDAEVVWAGPDMKAVLGKGSFVSNPVVSAVLSDKTGRFALEVPHDATWVCAAKAEVGFGAAPLEEARQSGFLRLRPWARLDGRLVLNGNPQSQALVILSSVGMTNLWFYDKAYTAMTDETGRFTFPSVPAGRHRVGRGVRGFLSHGVDVEVEPGANQSVKLGGSGVRVVGRLLVPGAEPLWEESRAPAGLRQRDDGSGIYFGFEFGESGAFHVEAVPPGRYELEAHWHEFEAAGNREICHGAWRTNVIVPAQAEMDLGDLFWQKPSGDK